MLHSFPQSIFRKKTGLPKSISTFYASVWRNHKHLRGTFVTKPVQFQSQCRQNKKQPFSELVMQLQYFTLTCFHKDDFLFVLEFIHAGSKNYSSAII
jgi:hypothetical protein